MVVGVPKESCAGERRVAIAPNALAQFKKVKVDVVVESGAGDRAGFSDQAYAEAGARIASRDEVFASADVIAMVRSLGANVQSYQADLARMKQGQLLVSCSDPLSEPAPVQDAARAGITAFSLELIPRTTRAQTMDVLSSQANLAGYRAVLLAATIASKVLPMMTTAAGTISPAKAFVIGAGVAGLQAIATAKRLGAVTTAYDVRPAVKEQIESLGARFAEMPIEAGDAQDKGGYAKEMGEDFYRRQREFMKSVLAEMDIVVTTAAIPGKRSPVLVTKEMVEAMKPGAVIVDLAAERGGNCELTQADQTVVHHNVTILGPTNMASDLALDASMLFGKNIANFLLNMTDKEGSLKIDTNDEIVRDSMLCTGGEVVNPRIRELLGLPALNPESTQA